jgi:SPP1 gp7 family putative phage head morphogenesis protein
VLRARAHIETETASFLRLAREQVIAAVRGTSKAAAGDEDDHKANEAAEALDYEPLKTALEPTLKQVAADGARLALDQVTDPIETMLQQANERAIAWAEERAGELVTQVSETTRAAVADLVTHALEDGWSNDDLAEALAEDGAFAPSRAERIARTETAFADVAGNLEGYAASGVVAAKKWIVADANECDLCAELDGVEVGLDEEFPGEGGDGPPLHVNCRCDVLPVLAEDEA